MSKEQEPRSTNEILQYNAVRVRVLLAEIQEAFPNFAQNYRLTAEIEDEKLKVRATRVASTPDQPKPMYDFLEEEIDQSQITGYHFDFTRLHNIVSKLIDLLENS